jgi:hypothetical protein
VSNSCFIGKIRDVTTQYTDAIPVVIGSSYVALFVSQSRTESFMTCLCK